MTFLTIMIGIALGVVFLIKLSSGTRKETQDKEEFLPYRKKQFLMTKAEYAFNKVLEEAVGDRYYIGRQVLLADLVEVIDSYKWNKSYRSKIDKKTIDFVLFNKAGYTPYLAIELDDSTHSQINRMERDRFVEAVFQRVGIRLERVKNAYSYNKMEIAGLL